MSRTLKKRIIDVGNEKMESLFTIVWNKDKGTFYIKRGLKTICRGKGGYFYRGCLYLNKSVLEFIQAPRGHPIICFEYYSLSHRYIVRFKGRTISYGKADGIAKKGINETYPHLLYFSLVRKIA